MSSLPVPENSVKPLPTVTLAGEAPVRVSPSALPTMTAGRLSPPRPSFDMATGSPITLLRTMTPSYPAETALRTFVLKVQTPRVTSTTWLVVVAAGRLVQALLRPVAGAVATDTYRSKIPLGSAGNSPTATPIVVESYVSGWPTKCWFVLAPTVMMSRARPGDPIVNGPGPSLPAEVTTTTPAATAVSRPLASRSLFPR